MRTLLLEELTWPEIKEALESGMKTVIIYSGAVEQHGPHLAESTDTTRGGSGLGGAAWKRACCSGGPSRRVPSPHGPAWQHLFAA